MSGSSHGTEGASRRRHDRARRLATTVAYWAAVLAVSLALVVALLMFFEARDASELQEGAEAPAETRSVARSSRANTTIRWAALYSGWQAVSTRRS
jgi:hypothetical protein